jgi:hypothetical protein
MTPAQCRAARWLVRMSLAELAAAAMVPMTLVWDFEAGVAPHLPNQADLDAMQTALENAGVEFTNGAGPGVRLKK